MITQRLIGLIIGTSLILNGLIVNSATANQSDTTGGTGHQNITVGVGGIDGGGSQAIRAVNDIRRFANELRNNRNLQRQRFNNRRRFSNNPSTPPRCNLRRFALGPAPSSENASSRSCSAAAQVPIGQDSTQLNEVNTLLENSRAFLERVNQDIEGTRSRVNNRLW